MQIYTFLFIGAIPSTRIKSFIQFCDGRNATIKDYLLDMLPKYPTGLSCRDISDISGIYVQSLTHPLKQLVEQNKLDVVGTKRQDKTNRLVQLYGISTGGIDNTKTDVK